MIDELQNAGDIVINKLDNWLETAIAMLPNFVIGILVVFIFYFLSRLTRKILDSILTKFMSNVSVIKLIQSLSSFLIMVVGLVIALSVLQLQKTVTSLLAGIGVLGLAFGIAFQDAAANFISGISMAVKSPIDVGDIIESNGYFGTVQKIGLRATTIYDPQGQNIVIPNRLIFQNPYKNYTINKERRIDLEVGISYGDDLQKVEDLSLEAIKKIEYLMKGKPVQLFFREFGDSSINFVVRYWVDYSRQPDYLQAVSDGIKNLKSSYNENDITIPFPIRTLDFGIKGGQKLDSMLSEGKNKKLNG